MKNNKKVAVVGLGKLGLCSALCFAKAGYQVQGYDPFKNVIESIKNKKFDNYEPQVIEFINKYKKKFNYSSKIIDILSANIIFIIVPTPSKKNFEFSNDYIFDFLNKFTKTINETHKKNFHLVISSTVMPGSSKKFCQYISRKTGLVLNKDFYFSYNPEFIALGSVIRDFLNPDFVLIGSSNDKAAKELIKIYNKTVKYKSINPMSLTSAEICKIALNSFVTAKISFANMLMRVADKFDDANYYDIAKAIGSDKRVSSHYFRPGLPFGGPCFPRDNEAFNKLQNNIGINKNYITKATIDSNKEHISFLNSKILKIIKSKKYKKICIVGLSFKNNTSVNERSYAKELSECFRKNKIKFKIYEKNINLKDKYVIYNKAIITNKLNEISNYDIYINTNSTHLPKKFKNIIDLWNLKK